MAFETIGERLRQARLNKKISLDELQQITKIQKRYLEAIEEDSFDQLPGKFYVRAFIRQYAQAVGEDGDKLVDVFDGKSDLIEGTAPKRPELEVVQGSRKEMRREDTAPSKFWTSLPVILLVLVALAIITVVGYMTWQDRRAEPIIADKASSLQVDNSVTTETTKKSSETSEETKETTEETSRSEEPKMMIEAGEDTGNTISVNVKHAEKPLKLEFTATNRVWVGIMINNAYVYQATLTAGESQSTELPDTPNATIVVGAANNIAIKANDKDIPINGADNPSTKNVNLTLEYAE